MQQIHFVRANVLLNKCEIYCVHKVGKAKNTELLKTYAYKVLDLAKNS